MAEDIAPEESPTTRHDVPWCPLSGAPCRRNCAWADLEVEMREDGFSESILCAMAVIAGNFLNLGGFEEI